ncbi:MAG TPA: cysteine desulfurase [Crocinitomix sp.]|nr:cysteine desulfurase [Crocinitomix sp.]
MRVYLDNAATTPMSPEVIEVMTDVMKNNFGNPSSIHSYGRDAKAVIENARRTVSKLINAEPKEIIFTSGGTEADNMALFSAINDLGVKHIISSTIEHHAVEHTYKKIQKNYKVKISLVKLDKKGNVDLDDLENLLSNSKEKTLVSLMHANNEIGTLLPLKKVSELCKKYNAYFHSDTVQTMAHYPFDLGSFQIDFLTCSAHKFHGPKGIGFLYVNKNLKINPIIEGGSQERGLRAGTENLIGIVGLAKALELANTDINDHIEHVKSLKYDMLQQLKSKIKDIEVNGEEIFEKSLYTVLSIKFPQFSKQEVLLFMLDLEGIACSGGSACSSGANAGSHVIKGIGGDTTKATIRFSFSRYTTKKDIDFAVEKVVKIFNS